MHCHIEAMMRDMVEPNRSQFSLSCTCSQSVVHHSIAWNWKGGITSLVMKIRGSIEYKNWRKEVFERDKFLCQNCGIRGRKLNAHHIKSFADFPEERFNIDNGINIFHPKFIN